MFNGKNLAKEIETELTARVQKLAEAYGKTPILATILVGSDPSSIIYVRMESNICRRKGFCCY